MKFEVGIKKTRHIVAAATECTAYTQSTRPAYDEAAASSQSITNSPVWGGAGTQYLLNVAWLRPGDAAQNLPRIPATKSAARHGIQDADCSEGGRCVGWIAHGDWLRYEGVDFGPKSERIEICAASASTGGVIELRLDGPEGELLGSCTVPNTGDWQSWTSFKTKSKPLSGVQTVAYLPKSIQGHAVLVAIACDQIIMGKDASIDQRRSFRSYWRPTCSCPRATTSPRTMAARTAVSLLSLMRGL